MPPLGAGERLGNIPFLESSQQRQTCLKKCHFVSLPQGAHMLQTQIAFKDVCPGALCSNLVKFDDMPQRSSFVAFFGEWGAKPLGVGQGSPPGAAARECTWACMACSAVEKTRGCENNRSRSLSLSPPPSKPCMPKFTRERRPPERTPDRLQVVGRGRPILQKSDKTRPQRHVVKESVRFCWKSPIFSLRIGHLGRSKGAKRLAVGEPGVGDRRDKAQGC